MSMTKSELVDMTAEKLGISKKDTGTVVSTFIDLLLEKIAECPDGEKVSVSGLGSWLKVRTPERSARNPKTGESIKVPARDRVRYRMSGQLKDVK